MFSYYTVSMMKGILLGHLSLEQIENADQKLFPLYFFFLEQLSSAQNRFSNIQ